MMILIRFPDEASERSALGWLPGRFTFKSWATREMVVPPEALSWLAMEGIRFSVEGKTTYEQHFPTVRRPSVIEVL
jgi:hypothetical protein